MIERDEGLIEAPELFKGLPDYKAFQTGAMEMVGFDSIIFMFDDDWDTHNLLFQIISTRIAGKRSGGYTTKVIMSKWTVQLQKIVVTFLSFQSTQVVQLES